MKRALISVYDKQGVVEFAKGLISLDFEIISTGGTAKLLADEGLAVTNVSDVTNFPECLDGRVKTLHPAINAGVLAIRSNSKHMRQLEELNISTIDLVAINLYPFKQTMENGTFSECVENIDIGGPTLLRAAAKNHPDVLAIVDPSDYNEVVDKLRQNAVTPELRLSLCAKVFEHTANYDAMIANYMAKAAKSDIFPEKLTLTFEKVQTMRYGENPHQRGAFYKEIGPNHGLIPNCVQLHGKELSYNNINDVNGALEILKEFSYAKCVVAVKHANPCGVGLASSVYGAYINAYDADPVSIFGGIIASNSEIDANTATEINNIFIEIVIAPSFSQHALEILKKKKNIRLLQLENITDKIGKNCYEYKRVAGGLLIQERDTELFEQLSYPTIKKPNPQQMRALEFGYRVVKHTKSNAIVIANDVMTLGIGPGQTNRITAAELAIKYAGDRAKGNIMASDAFFPFPDCVEAAAKAGIAAIIQPGGSINDQKTIECCDKYDIAMVFTNMRHFKH